MEAFDQGIHRKGLSNDIFHAQRPPGLEASHVAIGSEENERDLTPLWLLPQSLEELKAIHLWHRVIREDDIRHDGMVAQYLKRL